MEYIAAEEASVTESHDLPSPASRDPRAAVQGWLGGEMTELTDSSSVLDVRIPHLALGSAGGLDVVVVVISGHLQQTPPFFDPATEHRDGKYLGNVE